MKTKRSVLFTLLVLLAAILFHLACEAPTESQENPPEEQSKKLAESKLSEQDSMINEDTLYVQADNMSSSVNFCDTMETDSKYEVTCLETAAAPLPGPCEEVKSRMQEPGVSEEDFNTMVKMYAAACLPDGYDSKDPEVLCRRLKEKLKSMDPGSPDYPGLMEKAKKVCSSVAPPPEDRCKKLHEKLNFLSPDSPYYAKLKNLIVEECSKQLDDPALECRSFREKLSQMNPDSPEYMKLLEYAKKVCSSTAPPTDDPCILLREKISKTPQDSPEYSEMKAIYIRKCMDKPDTADRCSMLKQRLSKMDPTTPDYMKLRELLAQECYREPQPLHMTDTIIIMDTNRCEILHQRLRTLDPNSPEYARLKEVVAQCIVSSVYPPPNPCLELRRKISMLEPNTPEQERLMEIYKMECTELLPPVEPCEYIIKDMQNMPGEDVNFAKPHFELCRGGDPQIYCEHVDAMLLDQPSEYGEKVRDEYCSDPPADEDACRKAARIWSVYLYYRTSAEEYGIVKDNAYKACGQKMYELAEPEPTCEEIRSVLSGISDPTSDTYKVMREAAETCGP